MAPLSPAANSARGKIAALSRSRRPDDPDLVEARRELRAAKLECHIQRVLSEAPPLSDEQKVRIAGLLRAGGAA